MKLDSETAILLYYTPANGYSGSFSVKVNGEDYEAKKSGSRYVVEIPNIAAHMLSTMYTVVATTDNGSATVKVSVLSYVREMLENHTDAVSQNAAAAIFAYSQAADAYMEN